MQLILALACAPLFALLCAFAGVCGAVLLLLLLVDLFAAKKQPAAGTILLVALSLGVSAASGAALCACTGHLLAAPAPQAPDTDDGDISA